MPANNSRDSLQKNKDPTLNEGSLPDPPTFLHDQFILLEIRSRKVMVIPCLASVAVKRFNTVRAVDPHANPCPTTPRLSTYTSTDSLDYSRRIDFVKRGFSGYNTVNALSILPRIFPSPEQGRVRLVVCHS